MEEYKQILIIIGSIIFFGIECGLIYYLIKQIIRVHKLTLKDTAIYPIIILVAIGILFLLIAKFQFGPEKTSEGVEITNMEIVSSSLKEGVSIAAMSLDTGIVKILFDINNAAAKFLLVTYIYVYVISGLALMSISISLIVVGGTNLLRLSYYKFTKRKVEEIDYVLGFNDDCKEYLRNYYMNYLKKIPKSKSKYKKIRKKYFWMILRKKLRLCKEDSKFNEIESEYNDIKEKFEKLVKKVIIPSDFDSSFVEPIKYDGNKHYGLIDKIIEKNI